MYASHYIALHCIRIGFKVLEGRSDVEAKDEGISDGASPVYAAAMMLGAEGLYDEQRLLEPQVLLCLYR